MDDSEDEEREDFRGTEEGSANESSHRHAKSHESVVIVNGKKERRRRKHRNSDGSKYTTKSRPKNAEGRRNTSTSARDNGPESPRYRHRRSLSHRSTSSTSSSEADEPIPDHRAVLAAARARLTSPSMMSTFTTQTTATNTSSSSSGSNSTVTQMSVAKRSSLGKRPAGEAPLSPAVPDPPDVFTFMDPGAEHDTEDEEVREDIDTQQKGVVEEHSDNEEEEEEEESDEETPQWIQKQIEAAPIDSDLPSRMPSENGGSTSSSAASSFHGDDFSDPHADNDTDRSTSPERSVKGHEVHEPRPLETIPEIPENPRTTGAPDSPSPTPSLAPKDRASARMASQMAAAQQRQSLYGSMNQFGTPDMPRGNAQLPVVPPSVLSAPYQQQVSSRSLPRAEKLPVTGYELLASQLSTRADIEDGARIKPLYRKFEALNHRLLLHLQDELSELEEQLHRLDHADTQSRRADQYIIPASRRAAAIAGGELQWHKTDVLGRIGFKLAQYNQALTSFNSTQSLTPPTLDDIDQYREYLEMEQPIHEAETHFLDPEDDLISLSSQPLHHKSPYRRNHPSESPSEVSSSDLSSRPLASPRSDPSETSTERLIQAKENIQSIFPALAAAIATSILLPVLTFTVIPGFMGRLIVTGLVALFVIVALVQANILGRDFLLGREALMCAGIYGGVMIVIAGIMS